MHADTGEHMHFLEIEHPVNSYRKYYLFKANIPAELPKLSVEAQM
jgi:hypothetical protein